MEVTRRGVVLGAGALLVAIVIRLRSVIRRVLDKDGEYDGLDDVVSYSSRKIAGMITLVVPPALHCTRGGRSMYLIK